MFSIINYRYSNLCWRCRQKRAYADSTKSMKYIKEGNMYETNDDKMNTFIEEYGKEWEHIDHLSNEEQETILWGAVIDSFEKKFGVLES